MGRGSIGAPTIVGAPERGTHSCPAPFMIAEPSSRRRPVLDGTDDRRENGTRDAATGHLADAAADIRRRGGIGEQRYQHAQDLCAYAATNRTCDGVSKRS